MNDSRLRVQKSAQSKLSSSTGAASICSSLPSHPGLYKAVTVCWCLLLAADAIAIKNLDPVCCLEIFKSKLGSVLQRAFFWSNGRVTLYDQRNFSGRRLDLTGDCPHLQEKNFPERCNSVHVESGAWVGYEEQNYRGRQHLWDMYDSGDYPSADRWCSSSDQIASVRSLKQDQSVPRIHLFEWPGYSGRKCELQEDVPNMMSRFRVNHISSARVLGGIWVAYQEPNYRGAHFILERGDHNNCSEWGNHSGIIGSIRRVQFM